MFGAITGDIIGSVWEFNPTKKIDFPLFAPGSSYTDDTVLTVAVADVLLNKGDFAQSFRKYARRYPRAGYGGMFRKWAGSDSMGPYNSFGNGSAMRVSPVAWAFDSLEDVLKAAKMSAEVTHNHPEGIKGAQATAGAAFLARKGGSKKEIKAFVVDTFDYDLDRTLEEIRPEYYFDVTCQGSVPESIIAFLESSDYESAVRNAVSLGGDSDTMGAITGAIAEAYYAGVPDDITREVWGYLDEQLTYVLQKFMAKFID